ncbi:hypothetical protein ITJ44_08845 [Clavibacter sp. VKM Ac-2873]|uniref:hypothetical protein n=1 Tax=Clavibacter sp. VKM Ac-2873 TaxID=2783813 RepID=UPI00188CC030|nr:hypothetical protein [Clavibacter sp. VKM Ac-2873]MBF4618177.1 hypothetical protein [Clavibacter sp. VKM Ac-2873]
MPRTARASRALGLAAATLLAAVSLSACSPAYGCGEVGYQNVVDVQLAGSEQAVAQVALVRMCDEDGCSGTLEQSGPSADPDAALPEYAATPSGPGRWTIARGMTTPAQATFTALAADGTALAEDTADLSWSLADPDDRCDTVKRAGTIDLPVAG